MALFQKKSEEMTLKEVSELLQELRIPTSLVFTPVNLDEEKKKFFDSDTYNPVFKYTGVKNDNEKILKRLLSVKKITDVDPRISDFYLDLIASKDQANDLINAVGDNNLLTDISIKRFGLPTPKLFRNACRFLRGKTVHNYNLVQKKDDDEFLNYAEISAIFDKVFDILKLDEWEVAQSLNIAKNGVKVGIKRKQILVDKDIVRSKFKLKKTIVHEVGTHVLRAVNGLKSGVPALGNATTPDYLDVEEGLATWNESNMGLLTENWMKRKVALVYAIHVGKNMSFRELYDCLFGILSESGAFSVAYRVKRGLGDTSIPGIYAKDIAYFRGFKKVSAKLEKNPSLYNTLYSGKITFEQCEWVEDGLIPKAKNIPTKEDWIKIFKEVGL